MTVDDVQHIFPDVSALPPLDPEAAANAVPERAQQFLSAILGCKACHTQWIAAFPRGVSHVCWTCRTGADLEVVQWLEVVRPMASDQELLTLSFCGTSVLVSED